MCQPGRPSPHGLFQKFGPSSGLRAFHSAKSATFSRAYSSAALTSPAEFVACVRSVSRSRCESLVRELSVVGIGGNFEVDRAVRRDVGVPARDELFDHRDLQRDVRDGGGFGVRREHVQRGAVVVEFFRPDGGEFRKRFSLFLRAADRFVVHVGDVADVAHAQAVLLERAAQDVLQKERAEIADVRGPVDRRAAAVHAEFFSGSARRERAHGTGQRIV